MSDAVIASAARAAAEELAGQLGQPALAVDVEVALYAVERNAAEPSTAGAGPARFADPVALAGLILALTQFAYQVYTDQKKKHGRKPSGESVTREIHIRQSESGEITRSQQRILDVVIREVIKAADEEADE